MVPGQRSIITTAAGRHFQVDASGVTELSTQKSQAAGGRRLQAWSTSSQPGTTDFTMYSVDHCYYARDHCNNPAAGLLPELLPEHLQGLRAVLLDGYLQHALRQQRHHGVPHSIVACH